MNRPLYIFQRRKIMQLSHHSLLKNFLQKKSFHDNYPQKIRSMIFEAILCSFPHLKICIVFENPTHFVCLPTFKDDIFMVGESDFLNTQYGKDLRLVVRIEPVKYANAQTHQEIVDFMQVYSESFHNADSIITYSLRFSY